MRKFIIGLLTGILISVIAYWLFVNKPDTPALTITNTEIPSPTAAPTTAPSPEEQITMELAQKYNISTSEISLNISQISATHAKGTVSVTDGGGWFLAVFTENSWHLVDDGNGIVSCDKVLPYKFPQSMVPACVDQNGNLINQ